MKPINDYIFLEIEEKKENENGIILSDISKEQQPVGVVMAVGPAVDGIKAGDRIIFNSYIIKEINLENKKVFFIKSKDVYAIL